MNKKMEVNPVTGLTPEELVKTKLMEISMMGDITDYTPYAKRLLDELAKCQDVCPKCLGDVRKQERIATGQYIHDHSDRIWDINHQPRATIRITDVELLRDGQALKESKNK